MVNAEILYEDDEKIRILLKDTDRAFVNSIRRTLMSDTPKMAIETVSFIKKTVEEDGEVWETDGPLPDEVIAQRLAMIPIPTNHEQYYFQDECPNCADMVEEDRCALCTMLYYCQKKGSKEGVWVTAGDLNFLGEEEGFIPEKYQSIPITKLFHGQIIEFSATAIMGRGRDHVKWSPVCGVNFNPRQIGVINTKSRAKILWDLGLNIKAKDFNKDGRLEDVDKVDLLRKDLNHVGSGTEESREFKEAVVLEDVPNEFILSFETDGSMSPKVAFEKAVSELTARFGGIDDDLKAVL